MRKVKIAYLHSGLSIPGISNEIGVTLNPTDPQSKIKGASLYWSHEGLEVQLKGRFVLVPTTNIKSVELVPESREEPLSVA